MEHIPLFHEPVTEAERSAMHREFASGAISAGEPVARLEAEVRRLTGCDHAVVGPWASSALLHAMEAAGVSSGSGIHTTPFGPRDIEESVAALGATPSFSDISLASYNLDDDHVEATLAPSTRVILAVHLFGLPSPMDGLLDIAHRHKLRVIEFVEEAIGATFRGRPVGSLSDAAAFWWGQGDRIHGGAVTTNNGQVAESAKRARDQLPPPDARLRNRKGPPIVLEVEAALGAMYMARLPGALAQRRSNASHLNHAFSRISELVLPMEPAGLTHSWLRYTVRVRGGRRNALLAHLGARGVGTAVLYPKGVHQRKPFNDVAHGPLRRCEAATAEVLSLPVHEGLDTAQMDRIVEAVRSFFEA